MGERAAGDDGCDPCSIPNDGRGWDAVDDACGLSANRNDETGEDDGDRSVSRNAERCEAGIAMMARYPRRFG